MERASSKTSPAAVLDELSTWVLAQVAEFPIRSSWLDERFKRATAAAQAEALKAYRSTHSFDSSLTAGKRAFKRDVVGAQLMGSPPTSPTPSRATSDLWLETRDGESLGAVF